MKLTEEEIGLTVNALHSYIEKLDDTVKALAMDDLRANGGDIVAGFERSKVVALDLLVKLQEEDASNV